MSRSTSPEKSPRLSRRAVLPAPTALAAATGQTFSSNPVAAAIATDPRFALVDKFMRKIVAAEALWNATAEKSQKKLWQKRNDAWYAARRALERFERDVARQSNGSLSDAMLFAKIANFWDHVDAGHLGSKDGDLSQYPSFRRAIEASLLAANIVPWTTEQGGANV